MEFRGNQTQPSSGRGNTVAGQSQASTSSSSSSNNQGGGVQPTKTMQMQQQLSGKNKSLNPIIVAVAVVVVLALLGGTILMAKDSKGVAESSIKEDRYQAVFLTNGQVYFGKVSNINRQYVELSDIYYLQVQQTVQPAEQPVENAQQPQVSLAKLGSELHGPDDAMFISRDQVLFWENLKNDGKVTQAIKSDKNK